MPDSVPDADDAPIVVEHYDHRRDVDGDAVVASENPVTTLGEMLSHFPSHFEFTGVRVNDADVSIRDTIDMLVETDAVDHVNADITDPNGTVHPITHSEIAQFYDEPDAEWSSSTDSSVEGESGPGVDKQLDLDVGKELDELEAELHADDDDSDNEQDDGGISARSPGDVLMDNARLYAEKNDDYGNSWRLVGETIALWSDELNVESVDLSDPTQAAMLGLYWERLIKLVRGFNLEFSEQSPNNESTSESHADASTYAAMQAALEESRDD